MDGALESVLTFLFKYPPRLFERGELGIAPVLPPAALLGVALVAATLVALLYRALRGIRPLDKAVLGALRAGAIAVALLCLARPTLLLSSAVPQRNVLAILLDDSRSMRLADGDGGATRLAAVQQRFADSSALVRRFADRFAVRVFRFAASAAPLASGTSLAGSGGRTDIAAALDDVRGELAGMPLAGVVVVTDGADNGGSDLAPALASLKSRRVPVYTVGVGRERFDRDVAVNQVTTPSSALAGSTLFVEAGVGVRGLGGRTTTLTVEANGRIVATEEIALPRRGDVVRARLRVPPLPAGAYRLTVRARAAEGEQVLENNVYHTMLHVQPGPARILYVEGEPRPEFAFMRRAVAADSGLQLVGLVRTADRKYLRLGVRDSLELLGGFPTRREELFPFRAVILGSLESSFFTGEQLRMLADFVSVRGGTLLALGGRAALAEGGYAGTPVAEALPVALTRARNDTGAPALPVKVRLTEAGRAHPALRIRDTDAASQARWDSLPPLTTVNRIEALRAGATTLLTGHPEADDRAGGIPLLAFQRYGRGMGAVFAAQDSWLWRMHAEIAVDDATHATLWRQLLRWAVADVPDQVTVAALPALVNPGEPVTLRANVSDSAFVAIQSGSVVARVTTPTGAIVDVPMERSDRERGAYVARFVAPERGTYAVEAVAANGRDSTRSAEGALVAGDQGADVEQAELRSALLRQIAQETGGRYYPIADADRLADDVTFTESGITQRDAKDLWDMPVLFLLLVLLLGAEWGYRRRRGLA